MPLSESSTYTFLHNTDINFIFLLGETLYLSLCISDVITWPDIYVVVGPHTKI